MSDQNPIVSSPISIKYKVLTVEKELGGSDTDGIGNLVELPRLMFINEDWGNLKVVVDGGQLTRNNNRNRKSEASQPC